MALTVATKVSPQQGKWVFYTGGVGVSDNDTLLEVDIQGAIEVVAMNTAGSFDVTGSQDGTNYASSALAMEDLTATAPATRVIASTANKPVLIPHPGFKTLKFQQAGATACTGFSIGIRLA